jgi:transcriptional regulator with XRE-family HTH domain
MKERIAHILEMKNLTATKFADELDVQRSGISHILSGRNNPSLDFVIKIKETYPEFSLDWLLLGKGPVTISPSNERKVAKTSLSLFDLEEQHDSPTPDGLSTVKEPAVDTITEATAEEKKPVDEEKVAAGPKEAAPAPEGTRAAMSMKQRQVEKVIVLYSDQTFQAYNPDTAT